MPRYTGVRTFARLPHTQELDGVDVAVVGVPFDTATSYRPGARFGPEAIRSGLDAAAAVPPGCRGGRVRLPERSSTTGTWSITPGNAERTAGQIAEGLAPVLACGRGAARAGWGSLRRAGRAARARRGGRGAGRGRAARRARGHVGRVLRREVLPRHAVPARGRGGRDRAGAVAVRRHARAAVRGERPRRTRATWASS